MEQSSFVKFDKINQVTLRMGHRSCVFVKSVSADEATVNTDSNTEPTVPSVEDCAELDLESLPREGDASAPVGEERRERSVFSALKRVVRRIFT